VAAEGMHVVEQSSACRLTDRYGLSLGAARAAVVKGDGFQVHRRYSLSDNVADVHTGVWIEDVPGLEDHDTCPGPSL
jgi:hypothetical protein